MTEAVVGVIQGRGQEPRKAGDLQQLGMERNGILSEILQKKPTLQNPF